MTIEDDLKAQIIHLQQEVVELRQQQQKYRSLFELSGDALSILDLDSGRFIECNESAIRMHGVGSESNFLNLTPADLSPEFQPSGKPSAELAIERIQKTFSEGPQVFEWVHARLDGSTFPCLVSLSAIPLDDRNLVLAIGRDISNLIESQNKLASALQAADAANRAKSQFLSNMSHELRTPLNSIIGFSQILSRHTSITPEDREIIGHVHRSGEHLLGLINDVLDIAKIESGKIVVNTSQIDLFELTNDINQMFLPQFYEEQIEFIIEGLKDVPQFIETDARKLKQILLNLLSNACKFAPKGRIKLTYRYQDEQLSVTVEDTGFGIAAEEQEMVFNPFTQSEAGQRAKEGTGLGLPISRSFARLMGGDLTVRSAPNQGSCFTLTLPAPTITNTLSESVTNVYYSLQSNQSNNRILIVDDIESNRIVLQRFLQEMGFVTEQARNGEEAVILAKRFQPDLIFMDLKMPVMNGTEATRQIKTSYPTIKVVILTASVFDLSSSEESTLEADATLFKPFKEQQIVATLKRELNLTFVEHRISPSKKHDINVKSDRAYNVTNAYKIKALLVDDQTTNLIVAKAQMNNLGIDVTTVESGNEAIEQLQKFEFDLVITDCEMPEMSGVSLCKKLLQMRPNLPVIGFTADRDAHRASSQAAGMRDVLSKPIVEEEIEQILQPILSRINVSS